MSIYTHTVVQTQQLTMAALSQDNSPNVKTFGRSVSVGGEPVGERMTEESPARVLKTPERKKKNETERPTPPHIRKAWRVFDELMENEHDEEFMRKKFEEMDRKKRAAAEKAKRAAAEKAAEGGAAKTNGKFYSNMLAAKMLELRF